MCVKAARLGLRPAGSEGGAPLRSLYRTGISVLGYAGLLESDEVMGVLGKVVLSTMA